MSLSLNAKTRVKTYKYSSSEGEPSDTIHWLRASHAWAEKSVSGRLGCLRHCQGGETRGEEYLYKEVKVN